MLDNNPEIETLGIFSHRCIHCGDTDTPRRIEPVKRGSITLSSECSWALYCGVCGKQIVHNPEEEFSYVVDASLSSSSKLAGIPVNTSSVQLADIPVNTFFVGDLDGEPSMRCYFKYESVNADKSIVVCVGHHGHVLSDMSKIVTDYELVCVSEMSKSLWTIRAGNLVMK